MFLKLQMLISLFFLALSFNVMAVPLSDDMCALFDEEDLVDYASSHPLLEAPNCMEAVEESQNSCDNSDDGGGVDLAALAGGGGGASAQSQLGPAGIAAACQAEADMLEMAMISSLAFETTCTAAAGSCSSSCEISAEKLQLAIDAGEFSLACAQRIQAAYDSVGEGCGGISGMASDALAQVLATTAQIDAAKNCVAQARAQNEELVALCKIDHRNPACAQVSVNCSDPDNARTHPLCICRDPTMSASHPVCSPDGSTIPPAGSQVGEFASNAAESGAGTRRLSATALEGVLGETPQIQPVTPDPNRQQRPTANQARGGSGGGPKASRGGSRQQRRGRRAGPFETDVLKGTQSSRGGSLISGSRGPASRLNSNQRKDDSLKGLDLKKFMPKGNSPGLRGIASMGVDDGITGAMGPSIWEKLSRRYKKVQPFLEP